MRGVKIVRSISRLRTLLARHRARGKTIGFVPTLGALHRGHGSLVRACTRACDVTVVSIFVNPLQFGPREDFKSYPRTLGQDARLARAQGADFLFVPTAQEMIGGGVQTRVRLGRLADGLCGACRPGHFEGVATVVAKLFAIVQPHAAFFGAKDYQQFLVIRQMARDLNFPVRLWLCPTVREPDGLAMSSRNRHLSSRERRRALALIRSLRAGRSLVSRGTRNPRRIVREMKRVLASEVTRLEYAEAVSPEDLARPKVLRGRVLLAVAAFVGRTRLIDNLVVNL